MEELFMSWFLAAEHSLCQVDSPIQGFACVLLYLLSSCHVMLCYVLYND